MNAMKKFLIASQGENDRAAGVSTDCRACAAGDSELATPILA
ncbi:MULTISPECIES: hypothetical protein [unclassified Acidovorax]|nr:MULTISPECIES: hypothetical protein [unclassified Acidovorax]